jgi:Ca-activated chloride channel family protein
VRRARDESLWRGRGGVHMLVRMSAPFGVEARCERTSIASGKSSLWAAIRIDPKGKGLESERAPLALALVIDVSGSMKGDPIANVIKSCELVLALLGPRDRLAIVTFADHAGVRCGLTATDEAGRASVLAALRDVTADGHTNMHAGIAAGAGLLATASPELRRAMVVLSDGQPNRGLASATELARYIEALRPVGVSTLGFGLHHDENVLQAIAVAGSGRYAYVPDPVVARVELARAALAHGGIVADGLELRLRPAEGVELVQLLPAAQLRHGGSGVACAIGDVFVDESRVLALELAIDLPGARGELAELELRGRSPDGAQHVVTAKLVVDVHAGPHAIHRDAQRDILLVRGDAARASARAHADRGALPAAASLLRDMIAQIEASEGFARDDGSLLAELREQLVDEVANYEREGSDAERVHQRKAAMAFSPAQTPLAQPRLVAAPGQLVRPDGAAYPLYTFTVIGRARFNEIAISDPSLSRKHAAILYVDHKFLLQDLGSTNGCGVNGRPVAHAKHELADGDLVRIGHVELRFRKLR